MVIIELSSVHKKKWTKFSSRKFYFRPEFVKKKSFKLPIFVFWGKINFWKFIGYGQKVIKDQLMQFTAFFCKILFLEGELLGVKTWTSSLQVHSPKSDLSSVQVHLVKNWTKFSSKFTICELNLTELKHIGKFEFKKCIF